MKIDWQRVNNIPAYVPAQSVPLPPVSDAVSLPNNKRLGGPVGSLVLYGPNKPFNFETAKDAHKKLVWSLIRFVSKPIADKIGHHADMVNRCIWLCVDFKALRAQILAHGGDKTQNCIDATAFVSDLAGAVALVPKLEGAEKVAEICKFFELAGDEAHHGGVTCSGEDMDKFMAEYGGDEARQELLKAVNELCDE